MKVYVLLINDRHADPEIQVFTTPEAAIAAAKAAVTEYARHSEDIEEKQIADWLYFATYSCENDYVRVTECEINGYKQVRNHPPGICRTCGHLTGFYGCESDRDTGHCKCPIKKRVNRND